MKKFLVFLVSIIVVICLGMTFYAFAKDEEVIKFNTSSIYLNAGDTLSLDDIGYVHTNKKEETKINFNAGGNSTTAIIKYDDTLEKYVATKVGGTTKIVITTNNKKFKRFEINVEIGNGSQESPFHIRTEEELFAIGTSQFDTNPDNETNEALSANYKLMNDIVVTKSHASIGFDGENFNAFQGHFDGNFYTIKNLQTDSNIYGGLFGVVGSNAFVENIYFENASLTGSYNYVGTLAGVINGYVDRVGIINSNIVNASQLETSHTGGLAGKIATIVGNSENQDETVEELSSNAKTYRISIENNENNIISSNGYTGGIAGAIDCADIEGVKVASRIVGGTFVAGFAGTFTASETAGYIRESYSLSTVESNNQSAIKGALIGAIYAKDDDVFSVNADTVLLGLYYSKDLCNLDSYASTSFIINLTTVDGLTDNELKDPNSYTFFYDASSSGVIKWKATIWQITEGQYPLLKYTTYSVPSNIEKPSVDVNDPTTPDDSTPDNSTDNTTPNDPTDTPTTPDDSNNDNNTPTTPDTPIQDPDDINPDDTIVIDKTIVEIKSAEEFKNMTEEGYTYILTKDEYDFSNVDWTPIPFKNSVIKSQSGNPITIKNVTITPKTNYVGFFSSIDNCTLSNLNFLNVSFDLDVRDDIFYVGTLAGKVNKSKIENVIVEGTSIYSNLPSNTHIDKLAYYVGGLVGGFTTSSSTINNVIVNAEIGGNIRVAGGIAGNTTGNVTIKNSTFSGTLEAKETIGGIVGVHEGVVEDCIVNSLSLTNVSQTIVKTYIGGIVGFNHNTIKDSSVSVSMDITNDKPACNFYIGGVTGYNNSNNVVKGCVVTGSGINISNSKATVYLGGITGENKGYILECTNNMESIGSAKENIYVGGISATNYECATIQYCQTTSDLLGAYVGGLVYNNADSSLIEECMIASIDGVVKPMIKGSSISALVHTLSSGTISNCLAITKTYGIDSSSESAGLVISLPYSNSNNKELYGTISKCIVVNNYDGNGTKYIDTPEAVLKKSRTTGTIIDCVIDNSNATNCKQAEYDKGIFGGKKEPASKSSYLITDKVGIRNFDNYTNFEMSSETNLVWYFELNEIPKLSYFLS